MDMIPLLEAQHLILTRRIESLVPVLRQGNLLKINQATKLFISELSQYLSLQEDAIRTVFDDQNLVIEIRREHQLINDHLDDIYVIHVTEPDGQFAEVIERIILAVTEKLENDIPLLEALRSEANQLYSVPNKVDLSLVKVA